MCIKGASLRPQLGSDLLAFFPGLSRFKDPLAVSLTNGGGGVSDIEFFVDVFDVVGHRGDADAEFVVEVGGDALADEGFLPNAFEAGVEQQGDESDGDDGRTPEEALEGFA